MAETHETKFPNRPIMPRNATRLPLWSAAAAGLLLLAGVEAYVAGWTRVASPGPVTSAHARLDATCAQCHGSTGEGVDALRCERCHDPLDTRHLEPAAHVLVGTGDEWKASHVAPVTCGACHVEHRGRLPARALEAAEDRQCSSCHGFSGFKNHPEFALVRADARSDVGLTLSHAGHLRYLQETGNSQTCETCHELQPDRRTYKPITFDRHCASCHLVAGKLTMDRRKEPSATGNVPSVLIAPVGTPPGQLSPPDTRGRQVLTGFAHRDPWVIERLNRLSAIIDPNGAVTASRRARLERAIRAARSAVDVGAIAGVAVQDLDRWAEDLRLDVAAIDAQRAAEPGALSASSQTSLRELATLLAPNDPAVASSLAAAAARPTPAPAAAPASAADVEARRAEITALLDAIDQRGDAAAKKAAADIRKRLASVAPSAGELTAENRRALIDQLESLERAFVLVERQAGGMLAAELRQITDVVREQIASGMPGAALTAHQDEITQLLDVLEPRADAVQKRRIADIRATLSRLADGNAGDLSLERRREEKLRLLERVLLQRELHDAVDGPSENQISNQRAMANSTAMDWTMQVAALKPGASTLPPVAADPLAAKKGVRALLDVCISCHRMNADETGLMPVRRGLDQLVQADFSHKEHEGQKCASCHVGVDKSASSEHTLLPGVASCQTCHKPGDARDSCAGCHTYHSRPGATLGTFR